METLGQAINEIKGKFEGGVSFNVGWYDLSAQARRKMMKKINPRSAKRRVEIFGGLSNELPLYTCPSDVSVPASLYPTGNSYSGRTFKYKAPKAFFNNEPAISTYRSGSSNAFTIDYINGVPFIVAQADMGQAATITGMTDPTEFGGVSLSTTTRNYVSGSSALYGTFTDAAYTVTKTLTETLDIELYNRGVVTVPFETADVSKVEYVAIRLKTDGSNYIELTTDAAGLNTQYFDNWNLARFDMRNLAETGTVDLASIASIEVDVKMNTGETQTVTLDTIQIHQTHAAMFEYYSHKIFQSEAGVFLAKPTVDTDIILLQEEEYDIWFYEMCNLIVQDATYDGIDSKESQRFISALAEAYDEYDMRYPSMEEPQSYNISSEIDLETTYDN